STIEFLTAREILDSRGRPTVYATCGLSSGAIASVSVPSGASTGQAESCELRDGDPKRYRGLGCRQAVANVNGEIAGAMVGSSFESHAAFDQTLIHLDGTPNKARLGSNAVLAASLAFARALARERRVPLHIYFASLLGQERQALPRLTINLLSGGKHAGRQVAIQDVLIVPVSSNTIDESLVMAFDVYQAAAALVERRYGMRLLTADEGGLAPPCESVEAMIQTAVGAIESAGYRPGADVALAIDIAASHFYSDGHYHLDGLALSSEEMIARVRDWVTRFPLVSVEDALAEDDWEHWPKLREAIEKKARVVGDDLLCTNPARIRRAIDTKSCNTLLLKVNQVGTVSEALTALQMARSAGWQAIASARSGETEDNWLADLAVGWSADQIKVGSITQSERLAKYNRLLAIEAETAWPVVPFRTI
ncbi:MAG TPA: enolase, partial [Terriglobia bacterium]|nr:enolase [Terriglobia bacterium]